MSSPALVDPYFDDYGMPTGRTADEVYPDLLRDLMTKVVADGNLHTGKLFALLNPVATQHLMLDAGGGTRYTHMGQRSLDVARDDVATYMLGVRTLGTFSCPLHEALHEVRAPSNAVGVIMVGQDYLETTGTPCSSGAPESNSRAPFAYLVTRSGQQYTLVWPEGQAEPSIGQTRASRVLLPLLTSRILRSPEPDAYAVSHSDPNPTDAALVGPHLGGYLAHQVRVLLEAVMDAEVGEQDPSTGVSHLENLRSYVTALEPGEASEVLVVGALLSGLRRVLCAATADGATLDPDRVDTLTRAVGVEDLGELMQLSRHVVARGFTGLAQAHTLSNHPMLPAHLTGAVAHWAGEPLLAHLVLTYHPGPAIDDQLQRIAELTCPQTANLVRDVLLAGDLHEDSHLNL
jgi:hypothetical protein